jgi:hypothetical protein
MKGTAKNKLGKIDKNYIKCAVINLQLCKYKWKTHNNCLETEKVNICATEINKTLGL